MSYLEKFWKTWPLLASTLLMAAGALSINCGMAGPDPGLVVPKSFQEAWYNRSILLRDSDRLRCVRIGYCELANCQTRCTLYTPNTADPNIIDKTVIDHCNFQQELSNVGDSLVLSCDSCGPNGEGQEIFRVDSGEELYATETLIVDRNNPEKSFELLDGTFYDLCSDYVRNQTLPVAEP